MNGPLRVMIVTLGLLAAGAPAARAGATLEDKVREFDLRNGMKFLVVERHEAPVALCAIMCNVGAANEGPNITGISHLIEHMMFKGTEMMGTTDYRKEVPFLKETDRLGDRTIALRREIGEWRFARLRAFSRSVVSSFSAEENARVGADKSKQTALMAEKIRALPAMPDSLVSVPDLLKADGKDYLALYLEYEQAWGEISRLMDGQRQYIKKDELWEVYMNNGARALNAFTSNDVTVYFSYLPSNRLELFMDLESDRMERPVFREFWSERDVVMEERRLAENDPDRVLGEAFYSVAFTASPYRWPVLGWMSDLQSIDRNALEEYHRIHYSPNNAVAVIVGDVNFEAVKKMAVRYFEAIPAQPMPPPVLTREPEQKGERRVVVEHTANPQLVIGFHKPVFPHPDAAALSVLESVLSAGRTSRLYKSVYEEQQLTAEAPNVSDGPGERFDNLLEIWAAPRNPHTLEEVEKAILAECERLKTEPISDRELQRVKNQLDAGKVRQLASNFGIGFQVGMGQAYYGDYHANFRNQDRIQQVTPEDVRRVARRYLTPANRTVAWRVQVADSTKAAPVAEEEIDPRALMQYVQSLPQDEQMQIMKTMQQMKSDGEREAFARELWKRAKAAQGGK